MVGAAAAPSTALLLLPEQGCDLDAVVAEAERRLILQALERMGGVRTQAAKLLGVSFRSLRYRLAKLGIEAAVDGESEDDDGGRSSSPEGRGG
jgi:two-component system response regulator PilR (NtrC family)